LRHPRATNPDIVGDLLVPADSVGMVKAINEIGFQAEE